MSWQSIDENTYIDDTLVTCAEYQLFIDGLREQEKYFQPDHWNSYKFRKGKAKEPILGVRHSDATAFCEWLTKREEGDWHYRLPTLEGTNKYRLMNQSYLILGYWTKANTTQRNFAWIGNSPFNPRGIQPTIFKDLEFQHEKEERNPKISIQNTVEDWMLDIDAVIKLILSRKLTSKVDRTINLHHAISRFLEPNFTKLMDNYFKGIEKGRRTTVYINNMVNIQWTWKDAVTRTLTNVFKEANSLDLSYANEAASSIESILFKFVAVAAGGKSVKVKELISTASLSRKLVVDLYTLQERLAGRSPAFEGIRLVKERTR